jgi:hypothetical protein
MIMSYTGKGINLNKFDRFDKNVELKSNVIELSLIDDLIAIRKKADDEIKSGFQVRSEGKDLVRKGIQNEKNAQNFASDGIKIGNEILTKMKELGIQDNKVNELVNSFKATISNSKDRLKRIEKGVTSFN